MNCNDCAHNGVCHNYGELCNDFLLKGRVIPENRNLVFCKDCKFKNKEKCEIWGRKTQNNGYCYVGFPDKKYSLETEYERND